ncbi:MAG TPA: hypothetical protein VH877_27075, partial [Polyangia bacterium]|nr:hypothetical protein [Polyangia bacterium]
AAVRAQALKAATGLPEERLLALAQRGLGDTDPEVQQAALEALETYAGDDPKGPRAKAVVPLLKKTLAEGGAAAQARAGLLLARLTPPAAPEAPEERDEEEAAPAGRPAARPTSAPAPENPEEPEAPPDLASTAETPDLATAPAPAPGTGAVPSPTPGAPGHAPGGAPEDPTQGQPDDGQLAMASGELALQAGQYAKAIEELHRAQKLDPKLPVSFSLAEAYRQMGDHTINSARQKAAYRQALGYYRRSRDRRAKAYVQELEERLRE